jgi:hypothetical protein
MLRSLIAASLLALNPPPPVPADYQVCVPIHNGPIARPDHYGLPWQRKAGPRMIVLTIAPADRRAIAVRCSSGGLMLGQRCGR